MISSSFAASRPPSTATTFSNLCSFKKEPSFGGYYNKVYALYEKIRNIQKNLGARYDEGATYEQIVAEMDAAFNDVG